MTMDLCFELLRNEAFLMQGCFKSSFRTLATGSSADRGPFYVAFFNYAIGLERLLKLIILMEHWRTHRVFMDNEALRAKGGKGGHNVAKLYSEAREHLAAYGIGADPKLDSLHDELLNFLTSFANGNRYFNLDKITEEPKAKTNKDPLAEWERLLTEVHAKDIAESERQSSEADVNEVLEATAEATYVPSTSLGGKDQSRDEFYQEHAMIRLVLPHMKWRLVQLLIPMRNLLIAIQERIHEDDLNRGEESASVPYFEEFLDFVCEKKIVFESQDWP